MLIWAGSYNLGEHTAEDRDVGGSNPSQPTFYFYCLEFWVGGLEFERPYSILLTPNNRYGFWVPKIKIRIPASISYPLKEFVCNVQGKKVIFPLQICFINVGGN